MRKVLSGRDQDDLTKERNKKVSLTSKGKDMGVKVALDLLDFDPEQED